jgi:Protein of unknown function with HXXEE motif
MKFIRRHWYNIGGVVAIAAAICLAAAWSGLDVLQRLLLMNFVALLIHQFEEYGWPGGEPAIMNMVLRPSPHPDRFPLNQNSAMIVNVLAAYGFYLLPVFLPRVIWLGIAPTLFGFSQFIIHGIITNKKMRSFYNPGLAAVVVLHFPIGAYYIYLVQSRGLASIWDWLIGIAYLFIFIFVTLLKMTYTWLADENSPYVFAPEEMRRFDVPQKLTALRRATRKS